MTENNTYNIHHHKNKKYQHKQEYHNDYKEYVYSNPYPKIYGTLKQDKQKDSLILNKIYNMIPQREQVYIEKTIPYVRQTAHHLPEIFMFSGVSIMSIFTFVLVGKIKNKIKKKFSKPELVVKAPVHVEEDNKFYLTRNPYPEDVKPVYGVKLEVTRTLNPDSRENNKLYKKTKAELKVLRKDTCQCCGLIYNGPEFHHLNNDHTDHRPENLAMLCRYCHLQYHVDVARGDGGLTGFLPDFSVAELSHLQQYMIWLERKNMEGKISQVLWSEHERIQKGLNYRADIAMAIFKNNSFAKFCKYDQQIQEGHTPPKLSKRDIETLTRFKKIRYGLKVIFPDISPKDNSKQGRRYVESVHAFMNVDRNSFPKGKILELLQRINSIPHMSHDVQMLWDDSGYKKNKKSHQ